MAQARAKSSATTTQPATSGQPASITGAFKPGAQIQESLGLCIYGKSGVGKTSTLRTMPGRGLVIDVPALEGRTFVLAGCDNIEVKTIEDWDEIDDIYWYLARDNKPREGGYRWVAIDSITAMQELARRKVVKERALDADPHQTTQPEYGKIGSLVGEMVYKFRKLPTHTIWIAQERTFGDDGSMKKIGPDLLPGALAKVMPSLLLVGRMRINTLLDGTMERHMRIQPSDGFEAKATTNPTVPQLPQSIRNINLGNLLVYMVTGKGEPPEAVNEMNQFVLG